MNSARSKRVLILEISTGGHHPSYVRWLLESDLAESAILILAAPKKMFEHPEIVACKASFAPHQIDVEPELEARLGDFSAMGLVKRSWAVGRLYRQVCSAISDQGKVDFVIIPFLDDCLLGLAMPREAFGGIPWLAITMRTMFHYREMGVVAPQQSAAFIRRLLFSRVLRQKSMVSLLTIDPTLAEFAKGAHETLQRKVRRLPDPANFYSELQTKAESRGQLDIPVEARVVLLYGEISPRKGVYSLLEAAADPACSIQVHVLLAGRCQEQNALESNRSYQSLLQAGRLHSVNGYLDSVQERCVLSAADCMWLGYTNFYGMSGIMVLSGRHAVPVLASQDGLIGYLAKRYELGMLVEPGNRSSVLAALNALVNDPGFFERAGENGVPLFKDHSPSVLQRLVASSAQDSWARVNST
jgi:glycosyltransferase involved in cell wall biosynthesis